MATIGHQSHTAKLSTGPNLTEQWQAKHGK